MLQRVSQAPGLRLESTRRVPDDSSQRIDAFPMPTTLAILIDMARHALRR